ncbi:MAG: GNAT family N-acetyltransferase [bacterium]|nr:GNAT family N-acetyltransferase [bacterium]
MVKGKFLTSKDDLSEVFRIRNEVFCKEQGIASELEHDAFDNGAIHVLINDHDCNVAVGRLVQEQGEYSIGRVAVIKEERGNYYGDFVVRMLVDKAFRLGAKEVKILAQKDTVPFYKKIGFAEAGEECVKVNIPHIPMTIKQTMMCSHCQK